MLSGVEWGEYRIGDLFEVLSYKKRFDANKVTLHSSGHPYIVRTSVNNGCKGYLQEDEAYLNEGNTLSFGQDTATVFYQEISYFTGDKIKILKCKDRRFKKEIAPFFISTIDRAFSLFSWGSSSFSEKAIKAQLISLPTRDGKIDFMFMERFVAELKAQRVAELKAYLIVTGLSDYTLTPEEQQAIQDFQEGNLQWHDYRLGDLFEIRPTKSYKYTNRDLFSFEGDTPVVTNTSLNKGISGTVGLPPTEEGGIITYSDTTTSEAIFYQDKPFVGYSHIQGLYPRVYKDIWVESTLLYVVVAFRKVAHNKFDYGNKFNRNIASNMYIQLPTSSDKLDYTQMETFIRAIEKLVIRDVVLYADRELAATQQVINQ